MTQHLPGGSGDPNSDELLDPRSSSTKNSLQVPLKAFAKAEKALSAKKQPFDEKSTVAFYANWLTNRVGQESMDEFLTKVIDCQVDPFPGKGTFSYQVGQPPRPAEPSPKKPSGANPAPSGAAPTGAEVAPGTTARPPASVAEPLPPPIVGARPPPKDPKGPDSKGKGKPPKSDDKKGKEPYVPSKEATQAVAAIVAALEGLNPRDRGYALSRVKTLYDIGDVAAQSSAKSKKAKGKGGPPAWKAVYENSEEFKQLQAASPDSPDYKGLQNAAFRKRSEIKAAGKAEKSSV